MKWTEEATNGLKKMCYAGVSNKEIAAAFGCKLSEIYNRRSQLGITIAKCKTPAQPMKEEKPKRAGLNKVVKTIFNKLYDELLLLIANDFISDNRAEKYSALYDELLKLEEKYEKLLKEGE